VVAAEIRVYAKAGPVLEVVARPRLSLIIPAYNEETRLERTIRDVSDYLDRQPYDFEIIVSDDGSSDRTLQIADSYAAADERLRSITIRHAGKAAAIRAGIRAARGEVIAFTDADIVIGSREGSSATRVGEPIYRHVMGRVFNRLVQTLVLPGIDDTQCGFKAFTRFAAAELNRRARLYTEVQEVSGARVTAFDVEMLVIARKLHMRVVEVPVIWTYGSQSKVNPVTDTLHNFTDIAKVKINALRGRYD